MPNGPAHKTAVGAFSPNTAKQVLGMVRYLEQAGFAQKAGVAHPHNPAPETPLYFQNISDEEMPAYACMQIVGTKELEGMNYLLADKPRDTGGSNGPYLWNKHVKVPVDEYGTGTAGPHVVTQYDDSLDAVAGLELGPTQGQWYMSTGSLVNVAGPTLLLPPGEGHVVRGIVQHGPSMQLLAFDTEGYCETTNEPQYFIVTIDRIGNNAGPSQQPHDALEFPDNYTMIYHGFSHDRMTGGNAYNTHTWIYKVCDDSFDLNVYIDTNAMINWIDGLPENVGDPNDSWELNTDAPNICGFNIIDPSGLSLGGLQEYADICLAQNNLYDQVNVQELDTQWDDCNDFLCSERSAALNVVGREIKVRVTERPCGVTKVHKEDAEGYVTVRDTLGSFLYGRTNAEINCRRGVAAYMETPGEYECHWMIIWMDMFDEIQVVSDIIIGVAGIEIERKRVDIWRDCDLDDEYIEGNTCETS